MPVKFFGQFLIDEGELDADHVRDALELMEENNPHLGEIAVAQGFMTPRQTVQVSAEQRVRDAAFGDLAVELGFLEPAQLVEVVRIQRSGRLLIGEALVNLGHLPSDRLGPLLDAYKADQAQYEYSEHDLPDGLTNHRVSHFVLDLFPRFLMRVGRMQSKIGAIEVLRGVPEFAEIKVSVPLQGARGVEVALVCDFEFARDLAIASSGLPSSELDREMVADGVGEFLNVLSGNAACAMTQEGHRLELGPPDYDAELCDGWIIDLAVGRGRAALVLSTF